MTSQGQHCSKLGDFSPAVTSGLGAGSRDRGWAGLRQRCGKKDKGQGNQEDHIQNLGCLGTRRGHRERSQEVAEMAQWTWMGGELEGCSSVGFWRWRTFGW